MVTVVAIWSSRDIRLWACGPGVVQPVAVAVPKSDTVGNYLPHLKAIELPQVFGSVASWRITLSSRDTNSFTLNAWVEDISDPGPSIKIGDVLNQPLKSDGLLQFGINDEDSEGLKGCWLAIRYDGDQTASFKALSPPKVTLPKMRFDYDTTLNAEIPFNQPIELCVIQYSGRVRLHKFAFKVECKRTTSK